jgi:hypothetical protein
MNPSHIAQADAGKGAPEGKLLVRDRPSSKLIMLSYLIGRELLLRNF